MKRNYYKSCINVLNKLKQLHPEIPLGKHLYTSLNEHNLENLSDKDLYNNLFDYLSELESDVPHNENIDDIIKDGMNLERMFLNDEDEEE